MCMGIRVFKGSVCGGLGDEIRVLGRPMLEEDGRKVDALS